MGCLSVEIERPYFLTAMRHEYNVFPGLGKFAVGLTVRYPSKVIARFIIATGSELHPKDAALREIPCLRSSGGGSSGAGRQYSLSKGCNKKFSCASATSLALKDNEKGREGQGIK